MSDGQQLKLFIDNQPKSKIKIAQDLGMSKQNLFGLFKSRTFTEETKSRFENYFGKSIFTHDALPMVRDSETPNYSQDRQYIDSLKERLADKDALIKALEGKYSFLEETYQDKIKSLESNLEKALSNQSVQMRQLDVLMEYIVEHFSEDTRKAKVEMHKLRVKIASVV